MRRYGALLELTNDPYEMVRDWATTSIGQTVSIDGPEIRDALLRRVNDADVFTRAEALHGLARRRDDRVVPYLVAEISAAGEHEGIFVDAAKSYLGFDDDLTSDFGGSSDRCNCRTGGRKGLAYCISREEADSPPLQTQYTVLNDRRLHFGRMFWQNIAFHIVGVLLVLYLLIQMKAERPAFIVALIVIGLATLLMNFNAHRLQRLEVIYETHLAAIETHWLATGEAGIKHPGIRPLQFSSNCYLGVGFHRPGLHSTGACRGAVISLRFISIVVFAGPFRDLRARASSFAAKLGPQKVSTLGPALRRLSRKRNPKTS